VKAKISAGGKIDRKLADVEQHAVHGYGWYASYGELLNQVAGWAERLEAEGTFGETEALLAQLLFSEYAAQLIGGIPMNQGETIRPADLGVAPETLEKLFAAPLLTLVNQGGGQAVKIRVADLVAASRGKATVEATGLDETFEMIRDQFHSFAEDKVIPFAHQWHLKDELIPMELVKQLGDLGVFGQSVA
jgi:(2S)-methylsuccinyl-CoA dehydrogenase